MYKASNKIIWQTSDQSTDPSIPTEDPKLDPHEIHLKPSPPLTEGTQNFKYKSAFQVEQNAPESTFFREIFQFIDNKRSSKFLEAYEIEVFRNDIPSYARSIVNIKLFSNDDLNPKDNYFKSVCAIFSLAGDDIYGGQLDKCCLYLEKFYKLAVAIERKRESQSAYLFSIEGKKTLQAVHRFWHDIANRLLASYLTYGGFLRRGFVNCQEVRKKSSDYFCTGYPMTWVSLTGFKSFQHFSSEKRLSLGADGLLYVLKTRNDSDGKLVAYYELLHPVTDTKIPFDVKKFMNF